MNRKWMLAGLGAVVVGAAGAVVAVSAGLPSAGSPAVVSNTSQHVPLTASVTRQVNLAPQPVGNVRFDRDMQGHLAATISLAGLTPGSTHSVWLVERGHGAALAGMDNITANSTGQANATVHSVYGSPIPADTRLEILEGVAGVFGTHNAVAAEPIADTAALPANPAGQTLRLHAQDVSLTGVNLGTPRGTATVSFNAGTHLVTVTVHANGLPQGNHAMHLHVGSCTQQGAPVVMMPDITVQANGQVNQTVQTTVDAKMFNALPASGFYLNIHQGDSNSILVSGAPALSFRPMLCGNV